MTFAYGKFSNEICLSLKMKLFFSRKNVSFFLPLGFFLKREKMGFRLTQTKNFLIRMNMYIYDIHKCKLFMDKFFFIQQWHSLFIIFIKKKTFKINMHNKVTSNAHHIIPKKMRFFFLFSKRHKEKRKKRNNKMSQCFKGFIEKKFGCLFKFSVSVRFFISIFILIFTFSNLNCLA